jgi:hypothetical protein
MSPPQIHLTGNLIFDNGGSGINDGEDNIVGGGGPPLFM